MDAAAQQATVEPAAAIIDRVGIVDAAMIGPVASDVVSAAELPATTRRELREREARAVSSRPLLFPNDAPAARPVPKKATDGVRDAGPVVGESSDSVDARPLRVKAKGRAARRSSGANRSRRPIGPAATRPASARTAKATRAVHPAGKPRVAATVTASSARPLGRIAMAKRRILSQLVTVGVMAGVGLILVATTVPANAFSRPVTAADSSPVSDAVAAPESVQDLKVDAIPAPTVTRDGYTVISQKQQTAAKYGNQLMLYTNDPNGTIQWPFPTGVPITSGFGARKVAGCGFCSTNHMGVDFTPGAGTPIQAVADGTVSLVDVSNSGLGNHVVIDHVVNGQKVQSVYAHMQFGSIKVARGQQIAVGQQVGNVGSTGASTGAHLHFEIHLDGTPVDPFAWLKANAN